jgi:hypothetical protein
MNQKLKSAAADVAVIHRYYRELVRPADAVKWFAVAPEGVLLEPETVKQLKTVN